VGVNTHQNYVHRVVGSAYTPPADVLNVVRKCQMWLISKIDYLELSCTS